METFARGGRKHKHPHETRTMKTSDTPRKPARSGSGWRLGRLAAAAFAGLALIGAPAPTSGQDAADMAGKWKLVVLQFGADDFLILDVTKEGEGYATSVASAQSFLPQASAGGVVCDGETLTFTVDSAGVRNTFTGTIRKDAPDVVLGTFAFRGTAYPARLERTNDAQVGALTQAVYREIMTAAQQREVPARVAALKGLIEKHAGEPVLGYAYNALMNAAAAPGSEIPAEELKGWIASWLASAEPYGAAHVASVRKQALTAAMNLKGQDELLLDLARTVEAGQDESSSAEDRLTVANAIAKAAAGLGRTELAAEAKARAAELEAAMDREYLKDKPFEPKPYTRADASTNRVVLMELFTGAECPPCVAADLAFDGLIETYQPTELITLQYHLHIPGPDPLTNTDSEQRSAYYQPRGTPSTYFNGESAAGGGGGRANAEAKYGQYREVIESKLAGKRDAEIALTAEQAGDTIRIAYEATTGSKSNNARLRFALTEELVKYVGGNGLRFHHHVVRDLPGGAEGLALKDGAAKGELTVSLTELRKEIEAYLEKYQAERGFRRALPEIALKDLKVVAFVQDDDDKTVLHAVQAEVAPAKP